MNLVIGDRSFRLRVKPEDEEQVRQTFKLINEKIVEFKTAFAGKDMQDYISMVLIWFATEQSRAAGQLMQWQRLAAELEEMEAAVEKTLG